MQRVVEFAPSFFLSSGRHPVLAEEHFGQGRWRGGRQPISRAVEGRGCGRGVTLTSLLPVRSSVASSQRHGGQQLAKMDGCSQVWHRVTEVEQVVDAESETTGRKSVVEAGPNILTDKTDINNLHTRLKCNI